MKFSIKNSSPFIKLLTGVACILLAICLKALRKYEFLQGALEAAGLIFVLLSIFVLYNGYKEKQLK